MFVENVESELQKRDNHTWVPSGWTPTTTSSRFQLVSQVACLDANSGCFRWGDRWIAFRHRSPSSAPVVVVVDLAAPSLRALRPHSLPRSPIPQILSSAALAQMLAQRSRSFPPLFLAPPRPFSATRALYRLSLHAHSSLSSFLHTVHSSSCLRLCNALRKFRFRLEDASRLLTPNWVFPMRQRHARSVGWRSPPA